MLLGFYQFKPHFGSVSDNLDKIETALRSHQFDLVVLPELCTTGYQFTSHKEVENLAENIPQGESVQRFQQIAQEKNAFIAAGIVEEDNGYYYNSAVIVGPEGVVTRYRKLHLFFEETLWFSQGTELPKVINIKGTNVGIAICFDWIFPELIRSIALSGAEVVVHPSNLVLPYCQSAMKTRSIENKIFTVTANRIGTEDRGGKKPLTFTGNSQITNVRGEILVAASDNEEVFRAVSIHSKDAEDKKITPYNTLFEDRRPDIYAEALLNRHKKGD